LRDQVWRTYPLIWKSWAEEYLIFNTVSGNTHLLTATAARALRLLENSPSTIGEIAKKFATDADVDIDDELIDQVATLVANLDNLGLVEPITR